MNNYFFKTLLIAVAAPCLLHAQVIKKGDKIPNVILPAVINYNSQTASLWQFTGKPLLIHFWNTHCPVSQKALLTLKNMQSRYGSAMNIVAVTFENKQKVEALLSRLPYGKDLGFPIVTEDSVLRTMFPHTLQPHEVWIGSDGIVKAISADTCLTMEVAGRFITAGPFELPLKQDPLDIDLVHGGPLMNVLYPKYKESFLQYAFIGKGMDGIGSGISYAKAADGYWSVRLTNCAVYTLYATAYQKNSLHKSCIRLTPYDEDRFATKPKSNVNTFCFEMMMQAATKDEAYRIMQQQLDLYFGWKSRLEKRQVKCLVLRSNSAINTIISSGSRGETIYTDSSVVLKNIPLKAFIENTLYALPLVVINETGYNGRITLELPLNYNSITVLRRALQKYDLTLTEEDRELEVIALD